MSNKHKPTIETMINTAALALTSFGVYVITKGTPMWDDIAKGLLLVSFGALLEFVKYKGRANNLW